MKISDKQYTFRAIFGSDYGGYHGYVPSLAACHTWGKTLDETKENIREAIKSYVGSLVKDGERVLSDIGFETFEAFTTSDLRPRQA